MTDTPKQYRYKHAVEVDDISVAGGKYTRRITFNNVSHLITEEQFERDYEPVPAISKPTDGETGSFTLPSFGQKFTSPSGIKLSGAVDGHVGDIDVVEIGQAEGGWRPIDEALKTGVKMLLWIHNKHAPYGGSCAIGYYTTFDGGGFSWDGPSGEPTHFMPLPTPPKTEEQQG